MTNGPHLRYLQLLPNIPVLHQSVSKGLASLARTRGTGDVSEVTEADISDLFSLF